MHRIIKFSEKVWLEPTDMNTDIRKKANNDFEKDLFKFINKAVFGKTMQNVRKHIDIGLVATEARRNYLLSELNYHTTKHFSKNLLTR